MPGRPSKLMLLTAATVGGIGVVAGAAVDRGVESNRGSAEHMAAPAATPATLAAITQITRRGNRVTPEQVRVLLGHPTEVYRNNPRALCWRYTTPHEVRLCWGPKRQQAWLASSIPPSS
jgi:hypothetical protein